MAICVQKNETIWTYDYSVKLLLFDITDIKEDIASKACKILGINTESHKGAVINIFTGVLHGDRVDGQPIAKVIHCIDMLRSKGYMIPFEGVDLFEAGIAKKIELQRYSKENIIGLEFTDKDMPNILYKVARLEERDSNRVVIEWDNNGARNGIAYTIPHVCELIDNGKWVVKNSHV